MTISIRITYAFKAIIPQQFVCSEGSSRAMCNGSDISDKWALYVNTAYEVNTPDQWNSLGYLALFILGFQFAAFLSVR